MSIQKRVPIAGSNKAAHALAGTGTIDRNAIIEVTVRIRRKKSIEEKLKTGGLITHASYEKAFGSAHRDVEKVELFAHQYQLSTVEIDLARRILILSGTIANMESAFGVELNGSTDFEGKPIRVREGEIFIPANLKNIIEGVFGLDNRPIARPMFKVSANAGSASPATPAATIFTADQLATIYGFPTGFDGKGQTIAILEFGGGYQTADLVNYFKDLNINTPQIKTVSVDNGQNLPTTPQSADTEVMLDIEVVGAVAPAANLVVYFAPNSDQGFLDAITKAVHDKQNKPSVLSISWGSAEINWTSQAMNSMNEAFKSASLLGVTVCIAAGDSGSADSVADGKVHVNFPASSPYVLACGGTSLHVNGNAIVSEVVWHDSDSSATGGGVSEVFAKPSYQNNANVPVSINNGFVGRGVPDVAADADPATGYKILVDGQPMVVGGTSAVAPLYAGLVARINQEKGKSSGFINPVIYANPSLARDITVGNNNTTANNTGYPAGPGWDACTGLGVISKF